MARAQATDSGDNTRETILVSALEAFSEMGFDGATTRAIAARAGVNHGLIPYYFGSKPKLWEAAVDRAFSELDAGLRVVLDDPNVVDDRERIGLLIRNFVRFVARNPEFVRLMNEEGKRKGPRMRWIVDRHAKPLYEAVAALLHRDGMFARLPADIHPVHLHYILAGAAGLIFAQAEECKRLSGVDPFEAEVVEAHARAVEYLLLGPPSTA
jgi:TetR/AcrR family transcriptional regulator